MIRYILDTDHVSLLRRLHPRVSQRFRATDGDEIAITVITVEEQMQGWLSAVRKASNSVQADRLCYAYLGLRDGFQYLHQFQILDFDPSAYEQFRELRRQGIRIGTQDLRIAAIALVQRATVITRNQQDFAQVSGLALEDWSL